MSNGAGALMLEGRIVDPRRADCCNVFVNGFELTETETETQVPEPTTLALMGLGLAGIGYKRHRSKKAA
jgi:hypothetical protein